MARKGNCSDDYPSHCSRRPCIKPSSVFHVMPLVQFENKFPFYRQPGEIGRFSLDASRIFHDDASQLRIFCGYSQVEHYEQSITKGGEVEKFSINPIKVNYDLRKGYASYVCKDEETGERLDHLLRWITKNEHKFLIKGNEACPLSNSTSLNTDFISWRGHFTKFLCTPYETREPWQMAACKFRNTVFISEVLTEYKKRQELNRSELQKEMCYWGYKFEDYVTRPRHSEKDKEEKTVNSNEAFCTVVRTRLGHHSLVMGAEVDCQAPDGTNAPQSYIELKTSRKITNKRQASTFSSFKLLKFWAQSFLAGIPRVVCGFRDDNGIVEEIKTYQTLEIPKVAKQLGASWDPSVCMNFLTSLLEWIKEIVTDENSKTVYMFYFREPFEYIEYGVFKDGSEQFLPDWFIRQGELT